MGELIGLLGLAFTAGIRHGFDIDHIAAISDIVASQKAKSKAIGQAMLYGIGHGLVVAMLGVIALLVGKQIPSSIDVIFGKIVGVTLIFLGLYVLVMLFRNGSGTLVQSRWMLALRLVQRGYHGLLHAFHFSHTHTSQRKARYSNNLSFGIGMVHGVGAETPTQVAALATLAGIRSEGMGVIFLFLFVGGMFLSNVVVALFALGGVSASKRRKMVFMVLSLLTAALSIIVGTSFLFS